MGYRKIAHLLNERDIKTENGFVWKSNYVYSVGIELNTANLWTVYPNPANDIVNIILGSSIIAESINIYDLSGRLLEQFNINGKKELQINVSSYPKGTYLMTIHSNNGTLTKMLILGS